MNKRLYYSIFIAFTASACASDSTLTEAVCGRPCINNDAGEWSIIESQYQTGQCQSGIIECDSGTKVCVGYVVPSPEVCDYKDNDCDGLADEGLDYAVGAECTVDADGGISAADNTLQGECRNGTVSCDVYGNFACLNSILPTAETCDGLDNNCNGLVDDSPGDTPNMACPQIECLPQSPICSEGTWECPSETALGDEICDGLDNDCDGLIDEDEPHDPLFNNGTFVYDADPATSLNAPCRPGVLVCIDGVETVQGMVIPETEICDAIDNDCNGTVDDNLGNTEDYINYTGPAGTEFVGNCLPSRNSCENGQLVYHDEVLPLPEDCEDGIDNDCDGEIDEYSQEAVRQSFTLVLDISGSMDVYLDPLMSALCQWSSDGRLGESLFNVVVVAAKADDAAYQYNYPPISLTPGFVPASSVCAYITGPTGYASYDTVGREHQFEGVLTASESPWPHGMQRNVIIFSDEVLQGPTISGWGWPQAYSNLFTQHCVDNNYKLVTYSIDYLAAWGDLALTCGGNTHLLTDNEEDLIEMLLVDFVGNCYDPEVF